MSVCKSMSKDDAVCKSTVDAEYPDVTAKVLAFGSCHMNSKAVKPNQPIVWDAISALKPDAFLWAGDTIYTSKKSGISPLNLIQEEYNQLATNETLGYNSFISNSEVEGYLKGGVHGTWDDHDYGGNDYGKQMPDRKERQNLFLDFFGVDENDERRERDGLYSSVTFGKAPKQVKVIFLDTRSARSKHCIPSVGALPLPFGMGSAFACLTRWVSAGLKLQEFIPKCKNAKVLDEAQWTWLEEQLLGTEAQVNILVSSIQVLTTNPMTESWGQFPEERKRLLTILNQKRVAIISGDVHHGEVLVAGGGPGKLLEVTSSGLTHSCDDPFYGSLCEKVLKTWPEHRYEKRSKNNYYIGKNFGSIEIDWDDQDDGDGGENTMKINVHDVLGKPVLSTGSLPLPAFESQFTPRMISMARGPVDGHMLPLAIRICGAIFLITVGVGLRKFLFHLAFNEVTKRGMEVKEKKN